jgi:hypothetical protein
MNKLRNLFSLAVPLLLASVVYGQSTIANTPSTDVTERGTTYLEFNYGGHFGKYSEGGFQTYGIKTLFGAGRNLEFGANLAYTKTGGLSPVELSPNAKWKAYSNEKYKVAVSGGVIGFIPLRAESGTRPIAMLYTNVSKSFDYAKGFRLTAGVHTLVGAKEESGNRKGVMLGYEQTLYKNVSFFADWTSGQNRFAYSGVGLSIPVRKKNVFYAGYNFGNSGRGNNWLAITYGRFF